MRYLLEEDTRARGAPDLDLVFSLGSRRPSAKRAGRNVSNRVQVSQDHTSTQSAYHCNKSEANNMEVISKGVSFVVHLFAVIL